MRGVSREIRGVIVAWKLLRNRAIFWDRWWKFWGLGYLGGLVVAWA